MRKLFSCSLVSLFIISVVLTTVFFIPKYGEYRNGNMKMYGGTGYYSIFTTSTEFNTLDQANVASDLKIDYGQWLIITFAESVVFLLPAILMRTNKKASS